MHRVPSPLSQPPHSGCCNGLMEELHLPPGMRYDCVQCGMNCTDAWEIPVDDASIERMAAVDKEASRQRGQTGDAFVERAAGGMSHVLAMDHGKCVFLREDCLCALHADNGPKMKPQTCIDFPFRFARTDGGTFVGLSFACTAVLQDSGRGMEDWRDELQSAVHESVHQQQAGGNVRLAAGLEAPFSIYRRIEEALARIVTRTDCPIGDRLMAELVFFDLAVETLRVRVQASGPLGMKLGDEEREAVENAPAEELIDALSRQFIEKDFDRLSRIARRARPLGPLRRAMVGLITSIRQQGSKSSGFASRSLAASMGYVSHMVGLGRCRLPPLEGRMTHRALQRVAFAPLPGDELDALLTRFFRHALFRKDLLQAENCWTGLRHRVLVYCLIGMYSRGWALRRGAAAVELEDLREGLRLVEKYYSHHSRLLQFLSENPVFAMMSESLMRSPRYAASMTHISKL